jgi:hypothetical protein
VSKLIAKLAIKKIFIVFATLMSIVLSCYSQDVDTAEVGRKYRNLKRRTIDFSQSNEKITFEDIQELRKRLNYSKKRGTVPRHIAKIENDLCENYLLLKDQNITGENFIKHSINKKLWNGIEIDSLGSFKGKIAFSPDSSKQEERINHLISLGVKIDQFYFGPGGFLVEGSIPLFKLEEISLIEDVHQINRFHKDINNTDHTE